LYQAVIVFEVDVPDSTDIPIEHVQIVIIPRLNDTIVNAENSFPYLYLLFSLVLGVD
jgi:hypothetical protein